MQVQQALSKLFGFPGDLIFANLARTVAHGLTFNQVLHIENSRRTHLNAYLCHTI